MKVIVSRSKTWDGILTIAPGSQSTLPRVRRRPRISKPSMLPPLDSLPPPVSLSKSVCNIDLFVDFEREVKPFLKEALVSPFSPFKEGITSGAMALWQDLERPVPVLASRMLAFNLQRTYTRRGRAISCEYIVLVRRYILVQNYPCIILMKSNTTTLPN